MEGDGGGSRLVSVHLSAGWFRVRMLGAAIWTLPALGLEQTGRQGGGVGGGCRQPEQRIEAYCIHTLIFSLYTTSTYR